MKIYSMTATFGKLNHETLTFQPGLNIIDAPNEWGKSTWCAFILAMLYGIDTSSRSKKDFIADKERYAPWSGAPMSGRMDICWNGRDITIERSTKGRGIFGVFKAYETESGIAVPELTASNCGEKLLGVEQSVFARAGFVRLKDMPVTQDETLRRRLNALVTTGDESGSADTLAQKLKDLKNKCRFNRSGLLPQAEQQKKELSDKLEEAQSLRHQVSAFQNRQEELKEHQARLENHRQWLRYEADKNFAGKLAMAKAQLEIADDRAAALETVCASLPSVAELERKKQQLHELQEQMEALQMEIQLQPPEPRMPETAPQFRDADPGAVVQQAQRDLEEYTQLLESRKKPRKDYWIIGLIAMAAGIPFLILFENVILLAFGAVMTLFGILFQQLRKRNNQQLELQARQIERFYTPLKTDQWVGEARRYADACEDHQANLSDYRNKLHQLDARRRVLLNQIDTLTGGQTASRCEQETESALQHHRSYGEALREHSRLTEMVAMLESAHREVTPPQVPDSLTFTGAETDRMLSDVTVEMGQLRQRMGQCQGRIEALGDPEALRMQLEQVNARIEELEKIHSAAVLAQQTLEQARLELQRRFAPRIAQSAQELFSQLTGGRYRRLQLGEDFSLSAAAEEENTLHNALWRSDGTADQLYLALRLAVARELTPEAPLVLDDAFVRFDDDRLKEALQILKQTGESKQVLLFTCQNRERKLLEELS